jgi:hypothetical protein
VNRKFYEHYEPSGELVQVYCCPCCGYPTVGEPPSYEICQVCSWEDDDVTYDEPGATAANGDYSLAEARQNFQQHLTMYRANEECGPQLRQHGYKFIHDFELKPDKLERKRRLMSQLDLYMAEPDPHRRGEMWKELWK